MPSTTHTTTRNSPSPIHIIASSSTPPETWGMNTPLDFPLLQQLCAPRIPREILWMDACCGKEEGGAARSRQ
eukprot:3895347-Rhodomonas_salina.2